MFPKAYHDLTFALHILTEIARITYSVLPSLNSILLICPRLSSSDVERIICSPTRCRLLVCFALESMPTSKLLIGHRKQALCECTPSNPCCKNTVIAKGSTKEDNSREPSEEAFANQTSSTSPSQLNDCFATSSSPLPEPRYWSPKNNAVFPVARPRGVETTNNSPELMKKLVIDLLSEENDPEVLQERERKKSLESERTASRHPHTCATWEGC